MALSKNKKIGGNDMENIKKIDTNNMAIDSREVAEMMGINHYQVLEKLEGTKKSKGIIPVLTDHNFMVSKYFLESTYKDSSGKENKCYLCTKMGCEFLANKFTGEKGILFTAKYVERFSEMESQLQKPSYAIENRIERAKAWIKEEEERQKLLLEVEQQQKEIEHKEDVIINLVDSVSLADKRQVLNRVVRHGKANFRERWRELYKQFNMKYHIDINKRTNNYNTKNKKKISKLDYIDKIMGKLPELYEIACKLYENDVKELLKEIYELNNKELLKA